MPVTRLGCIRNVLHQYSGVNRHVIDALLGLLLDDFEHDVDVKILDAANPGESFVNWDCADRHRRSVNDGLTDARNVTARRQIHHRVAAVLDRITELLQLLFNVREVVDELPMLALILQVEATPMHIGSRFV